jgi:cytochrome c
MACSLEFLVPFFVSVSGAIICAAAFAQTPWYPNVGRAPTGDEIRAMDIAVGPSGKELPPGSGVAKDGAAIYAKKCAACHMSDLQGSKSGPALVGGKGTLNTANPIRTVGSFWAFATTLYDFINRAMPKAAEGSLTPDEVYSLTAYILFKNDIVKETDVIDAKSLPRVRMPNRDGFLPAPWPSYKDYNTFCPAGTCR